MVMLGDILVLGLGASGYAAAAYCSQLIGDTVRSVCVYDGSRGALLSERAEQLERSGVRVRLGCEQVEGSFDLAIASPGIPPYAPLMRSARAVAEVVVSEVEFAFTQSSNPWVAVTGTNGKTTTTALITHLLIGGGFSARSVGNFGPPAIEAVQTASPGEILVAEVSSFQLALVRGFHPRVAVLLNVTPDHIDWHGSFSTYSADKGRVFSNLTPDDCAVVDVDDPEAALHAEALAERRVPVVRVSRGRDFSGGASAVGGVLTLHTQRGVIELVAADQLAVLGPHNVSNALAAGAAAHAMGVSAAALRAGLLSFLPIEHRLEPVGEYAGAEWFNDSKATNPDAVSKALDAFDGRALILLLGGRNKGNDFTELATQASRAAREVVVFGEARDEILAGFSQTGFTPQVAEKLADAVDLAASLAAPGDAVVLSPACASFDEFENYEERGRVFKSLVAGLSEGPNW